MADLTPFAELANVLKPNATGSDLVELLDGKAERTRTLHWRDGRAGAPQWAIDCLRAKLNARHAREQAIAAKASPGPGKRVGARNLAAYLARRA